VSRESVPRDCFLAVDFFSTFDFEDGDRLLASVRARAEGIRRTFEDARGASVPIVYANDCFGVWDGDAQGVVERALAGPGGDILSGIRPQAGDALVLKPRYSAFDLTPLPLVLEGLGSDRLLLAGTTTEMCVAQTAIDARERGYKVTVITDASASADPTLERTALAYLEAVTGTFLAASLVDALAS
jgi:nicotinamidase-related amidase